MQPFGAQSPETIATEQNLAPVTDSNAVEQEKTLETSPKQKSNVMRPQSWKDKIRALTAAMLVAAGGGLATQDANAQSMYGSSQYGSTTYGNTSSYGYQQGRVSVGDAVGLVARGVASGMVNETLRAGNIPVQVGFDQHGKAVVNVDINRSINQVMGLLHEKPQNVTTPESQQVMNQMNICFTLGPNSLVLRNVENESQFIKIDMQNNVKGLKIINIEYPSTNGSLVVPAVVIIYTDGNALVKKVAPFFKVVDQQSPRGKLIVGDVTTEIIGNIRQ